MTKHKGKYYLKYRAPETEFNGFGDGVYVGRNPLGPFEYQYHNSFSYKFSGFARGADMVRLLKTQKINIGIFLPLKYV